MDAWSELPIGGTWEFLRLKVAVNVGENLIQHVVMSSWKIYEVSCITEFGNAIIIMP